MPNTKRPLYKNHNLIDKNVFVYSRSQSTVLLSADSHRMFMMDVQTDIYRYQNHLGRQLGECGVEHHGLQYFSIQRQGHSFSPLN